MTLEPPVVDEDRDGDPRRPGECRETEDGEKCDEIAPAGSRRWTQLAPRPPREAGGGEERERGEHDGDGPAPTRSVENAEESVQQDSAADEADAQPLQHGRGQPRGEDLTRRRGARGEGRPRGGPRPPRGPPPGRCSRAAGSRAAKP